MAEKNRFTYVNGARLPEIHRIIQEEHRNTRRFGGKIRYPYWDLMFAMTKIATHLPGADLMIEIGLGYGTSLRAFSQLFEAASELFIVTTREPAMQEAGEKSLDLIREQGHGPRVCWNGSEAALAVVEDGLQGRKADLLHIDGDHSYKAAMRDWKLYGNFVRRGGLVIFHDATQPDYQDKSGRAWNEISPGYEHETLSNVGVLRIP